MLKITLLVLVLVVIIFVVPRLFSGSREAVPSTGSTAPDFTLFSQDGTSVSLQDYRGKWIVLYFYPKDQTPGCTRESAQLSGRSIKVRSAQLRGSGCERGQRKLTQEVLREGGFEFQALSRPRRQSQQGVWVADEPRSGKICGAAYLPHRPDRQSRKSVHQC